jgi:ribosomal protein L32
MDSNETGKFVEKNILNFHIIGKGWNDIIREMLVEIANSGWNLNKEIFGKEKHASLQCTWHSDGTENEIFRNIIMKYEKLSKVTCQYCGDKSKRRFYQHWEYTLCKNCYLEKATKEIYLKKRSNLEECKICGYFAFSEDICKFCGNYDYNTTDKFMSPKEDFESELEYVKHYQMDVFLDMDDEIEFSKRTKGYSKSESHKILYTIEELDEHRKLIDEWEKLDEH